jgi:hypothetical protein
MSHEEILEFIDAEIQRLTKKYNCNNIFEVVELLEARHEKR